jgi:hypothetical protein
MAATLVTSTVETNRIGVRRERLADGRRDDAAEALATHLGIGRDVAERGYTLIT